MAGMPGGGSMSDGGILDHLVDAIDDYADILLHNLLRPISRITIQLVPPDPAGAKGKACRQVDYRQHRTAQVDYTVDESRHHRHRGRLAVFDDF